MCVSLIRVENLKSEISKVANFWGKISPQHPVNDLNNPEMNKAKECFKKSPNKKVKVEYELPEIKSKYSNETSSDNYSD